MSVGCNNAAEANKFINMLFNNSASPSHDVVKPEPKDEEISNEIVSWASKYSISKKAYLSLLAVIKPYYPEVCNNSGELYDSDAIPEYTDSKIHQEFAELTSKIDLLINNNNLHGDIKPADSILEFHDICMRISSDADLRRRLVTQISKINESSPKDVVSKAMHLFLTDKTARFFNWTGINKRSFRETSVCDIILEGTSHFEDRRLIISKISAFLTQAPERFLELNNSKSC